MNINPEINSNTTIRAFYLFFIICNMQMGVGIMGAPVYIFDIAKQDAWISIIVSYLSVTLTVAVMFYILKQYNNTDIFGIQVDLFGQWIGKLLGTVYIVYFAATFITVLATYIQVIRIFLYPTFPIYMLALLLLALIIYSIFGGFRVIVGIAFIFLLLTQLLLFLLYDPITRMNWNHFFPMFQAPVMDILKGAKRTTFTMAGFEMLFLVYPFIQNKEKAKLPVFLGIAYSSFIFLVTTAISIGYFSLEYLGYLEWSVLTLFKSVMYTFVERVDLLVIVEWMMIVLPNNILFMWGVTYGLKRLYKIPQKISVFIVAGIALIIISMLKYEMQVLKLTDYIADVGFWLIFIYPFILLPLVILKKKWRQRKGMKLP